MTLVLFLSSLSRSAEEDDDIWAQLKNEGKEIHWIWMMKS